MSPYYGPQMLARGRRVGSRPVALRLARGTLAAGLTLSLAGATLAIPMASALSLSGVCGNGFAVRKRKEDDDQERADGSIPSNHSAGEWRARLLKSIRLQDRLRLLSDLGLNDREISEAIPQSSPRSVRRWRLEGVTDAREGARWRPVDDLCAIVGYLLADGTYDEYGAVAWLRSRHPELQQRYPLQALGEAGGFTDVLTAAEASLGAVVLAGPQPAGPVTQAISAAHSDSHATTGPTNNTNAETDPTNDAVQATGRTRASASKTTT